MAVDRTLVAGAGLVGQSKRQNWIDHFQKGLSASMAQAAKQQALSRAKKAQANARTAGYIESLNSNIDVSSLTSSQQRAVTNYLTKQKNVYANAATQIAKIDPDDPAYMRLRDEMNGVQMSFTTLASSLDQFKKDKESYLKDFDNSMLSNGNSTGAFVEASKIYTDEGELAIDDFGNINFWDNDSENYKKYSEIQKPFLKDFQAADKILQINEQVYNSGKSLTGARRNMIRQKLNTLISSGGRDTLLSLASDDFIIEGGLGIQDPTLFDKNNEAALKEAVLNGYMNVLEDSAAQGAIDNAPKYSGGGRGAGGRKTLPEELPAVEDALNFSNVYSTNVKPELREDKTLLLVNELNAIDPTKKGNYISRGTLYDMYLRDFESGDDYELEDTPETRADFINKYGDSQVYLFNEKDPVATSPVMINTDDPRQLYEFYLKNSNLTSRAQNYHIGQYDTYLNSTRKQKQNNKTESSSGSGAYDNL